ncbi:DUF6666 family protein [Neorhodopirellula pilleata]|uniref:Uncharacterized protein n=1 Tax=Neorhodopirellula pilleata TaxID=2714738 RepID=A0A5C6AVC0_9BACT|nr:DUF6666 family protein [Neorhodopirellula pilleata]TWU02074.1 hypothetical protein Pla100_18140 [Neorhodopirellula pilleata]
MITTSMPDADRATSIRLTFGLVFLMTCLCGLGSAPSANADGPVRVKRPQPPARMAWSPGRVEADAKAVPDQSASRRRSSAASQSAPLTSRAPRLLPDRRRSEIEQVGFLEDYGTCGPVCDCGHCGGYATDPGCGIEYEVGCGLEAACGAEVVCGAEPVCGLEAYGTCGCDACVGGLGCDTYACDTACEIDCFPLFLPILRIDWNRFEFFWGTQAYHNPMNDPATGATTQTDSGSFGFHQGFNEGRNLRPWLGADLAAQFGLRATQSNLHDEDFTNESRNQIFLTGGLFRRVDYGLQYGVVLDYLNEDWYYQADLLQLRGELSWMMSCHNFGFHWMAGVNDQNVTTRVFNEAGAVFNGTATIDASNQYRAFYRHFFASTGEWTTYIGGTDDDHFIVGSDMDIPLKSGFSMQINSTYFAPGSDGLVDHVSEGWNLGMSVVYRPGACHPANRYRRPLFDVADNGSFYTYR